MSGPFIKKIPPCTEGRQGEAHLVRMAIAGFHLVINSERIKTFQTGLCIIVFFNFFLSEIKNSTLFLRADKIYNGFSRSLSFFFFSGSMWILSNQSGFQPAPSAMEAQS